MNKERRKQVKQAIQKIEELVQSIFDDEHGCESTKYNKDECINCWRKYIENYMQKDGIK